MYLWLCVLCIPEYDTSFSTAVTDWKWPRRSCSICRHNHIMCFIPTMCFIMVSIFLEYCQMPVCYYHQARLPHPCSHEISYIFRCHAEIKGSWLHVIYNITCWKMIYIVRSTELSILNHDLNEHLLWGFAWSAFVEVICNMYIANIKTFHN